MTGPKPWRRYLESLASAPERSPEREIADRVTGMAFHEQIVAYLDGVMLDHPENDRRHEIAFELRQLLIGRAA